MQVTYASYLCKLLMQVTYASYLCKLLMQVTYAYADYSGIVSEMGYGNIFYGFIRAIERKPTYTHDILSCKARDTNYAEVLGIKLKISFLESDFLITEML